VCVCVCVCEREREREREIYEPQTMRRPRPALGRCATEKKKKEGRCQASFKMLFCNLPRGTVQQEKCQFFLLFHRAF